MTTFERILSELGDGLGVPLSPGAGGIAELFAEGRCVLLRADETGEREVLLSVAAATAPAGGFSAATLRTALELDLFGRDVAGHHLGLFADTLFLSATLPLEGLSAETLAERVLALARLAGGVSGRLAAAEAVSSPASPAPAGAGADFLSV